MDDTDSSSQSPDYVLYARVWPSMKAILIDAFILMGVFLAAALVGANLAGSGAIAFVIWFAFWVLYDPLMVSRTGGTIGHHVQNLRVVSDDTGRSPSFVTAFIRNILKGFLGGVSLLAMAVSSRQKALHDLMVGTTVQARDARFARLKHFTKVRRSQSDVG